MDERIKRYILPSLVLITASALLIGSVFYQRPKSKNTEGLPQEKSASFQTEKSFFEKPYIPLKSYALEPDDYDYSAEGLYRPIMRRWLKFVLREVKGDLNAAALVLAFIDVESNGRQFAVSRSGCVGLMQFCSMTAIRYPFNQIFDSTKLRSCACADRRCYMIRPIRRLFETSPPELYPLYQEELPCDISDQRFNPELSIKAGFTYINELYQAFEGNIYLSYIGYNSGPHVAERIWKRLGKKKASTIKGIRRVLARALRPNFKRKARRRSKALWKYHLPKLESYYRLYLDQLNRKDW